MKLSGKMTAVPIEHDGEEMTLYVALTWGQLKKIVREFEEVDAEADALAVLELVEGHLLNITKRVEGLEGDDDAPITGLTQEVLDDMLPEFVMAVWQAITSLGADTGQAMKDPLAGAAASAPSPETSPKESP